MDKPKNRVKVPLMIAAVAFGGYFLVQCNKSSDASGGTAAKSAEAGTDARVKVPLEGPSKGPATAKVNIVEFSDFQCPFCSRVVPTIQQIEKAYPNDVRIFFRHNPLPFHPNAPLAAEAAVAAQAQGKFWEMHDKMFANQQNILRPDLEKYAGEIGLDVGKFKEALDKGTGKATGQADLAAGQKIGVQGTPNFYIDGINLAGAQPFDEFKKVIDDELQRADKMLAKGTAQGQLYATFMASAKSSPTPAAAAAPPAPSTSC